MHRIRAVGLWSWAAAVVWVGLVALAIVVLAPAHRTRLELVAHKPSRASAVGLIAATHQVMAGHRADVKVVAYGARICSLRFHGPKGSRATRTLKFFPRDPVVQVSFKVAGSAAGGRWRLRLQCGTARRHPASLGAVAVRMRVKSSGGRHGSLVAAGSASMQASVVAAREAIPRIASAGSIPGASLPVWLPIRRTVMIGCVHNNCRFRTGPYHNYWAIDLLSPARKAGDPIYPAGGGRVHILSRSSRCGPIGSGTPANAVAVDHGGGLVTWYYHLQRILVTDGQLVTPDTELGTMDSTGMNFPCPTHHLHFEEVRKGVPVDFGSLKACHGNTLITYPQALGFSNWNSIPPFVAKYDIYSDGTACASDQIAVGVCGALGEGQPPIPAGSARCSRMERSASGSRRSPPTQSRRGHPIGAVSRSYG